MIDLDQIKAIKTATQALARDIQAYSKLRDRNTLGMTSNQAGKHSANLAWKAMHIDQATHDLHVLCVDAGLADCREPEHYEPVEYRPSGWHKYLHVRNKPKALKTGVSS